MVGWPISFSPNAKPGVKRKQENVATKADKRKYEDKHDRCFQEQGKLRNRKIISERKQTFYRNSLQVRRTNKESIFVGQSDNFQELCSDQHR
jgi:hypothetical protein